MRKTWLGVALIAGLTAAVDAKDLAGLLKGKWKVDQVAALEASPLYALSTPEKQKELREQALKGVPDAFVEFTEKEAVFTAGPGPADRATYRVVGGTDAKIDLELTSKDAQGKAIVDKTTAEMAGDVLRLRKQGDPFVLTLRRVK